MLTSLIKFCERHKIVIFCFIITVIGYILNISIYPTFWMDEAWDISVAWSFLNKGIFGNPTYPVGGLDKVFFLHPPLPILMEIPLIKCFGITPFTIHFVPIMLGLGTILVLYLLVKRLFGEKTAFWSAIFLAVNPLFFLTSRQLRPEIYVTFFTILSFYLLNVGKEKGKAIFYFLAGITSALSFLSHYYGAFLIGAIFIFLIISAFRNRSKSSRNHLLIFIIGVILIITPFLIWILKNFEIFKIQFLGNLPNLTGINKLLNTFLQEKERYFKYPEAIGLVGFAFLGLILFFKKLLIRAPELIIFFFTFPLGLAFFMPNKIVIYLAPIIPLTALAGGLMLTSKSDFLDNKRLGLVIKFIAFIFLSVSLIYTFKPQHTKAYFKAIPYSALKNNFNSIIEKNYQDGKIVGDPTYFLFLSNPRKENFISEHVLLRWLKENNNTMKDIFKEKQIQFFIYSPYWWDDLCRNDFIIRGNLKIYLEHNGTLLGEVTRGDGSIDYIYLTK